MIPIDGPMSSVDRIEHRDVRDMDGDGLPEDLVISRAQEWYDSSNYEPGCRRPPSGGPCFPSFPGWIDNYCEYMPAAEPFPIVFIRSGYDLVFSSGKKVYEIEHHGSDGEVLKAGDRVKWGAMGHYWYGTVAGFYTMIRESSEPGGDEIYVMANLRRDDGTYYGIDSRAIRHEGAVEGFFRGIAELF